MASVNGTIATEGFAEAPTLTVLSVTTAAREEVADNASPASAVAISASARRVRRAPIASGRPVGSIEMVSIVIVE